MRSDSSSCVGCCHKCSEVRIRSVIWRTGSANCVGGLDQCALLCTNMCKELFTQCLAAPWCSPCCGTSSAPNVCTRRGIIPTSVVTIYALCAARGGLLCGGHTRVSLQSDQSASHFHELAMHCTADAPSETANTKRNFDSFSYKRAICAQTLFPPLLNSRVYFRAEVVDSARLVICPVIFASHSRRTDGDCVKFKAGSFREFGSPAWQDFGAEQVR